MADERWLSQVNIRASAAVAVRVGAALGVALPVEPNTVSTSGERSALWLGPDEWLVVDGSTTADEIETAVRQAFMPDWGSVVDVSANRAVVELSGPHTRALLAKGCSLDLHPRSFRPGMCAQTLLAKTAVILWQTDDAPTFKVFVRASFAAHLARWLADASVEFA
jgi:sarcosine oxidase subunit gamma